MSKRTSRPPGAPVARGKKTEDMFQEMMKKPALNGGFTTLLSQVQQIRDVQESMVVKVDGIHEAIYDPDNGLFSRVKDVENKIPDKTKYEKLTEDVASLKQQAKIDERTSVTDEKVAETQKVALDLHDEQLKDLKQFKERVVTIVKWLLVTMATGSATLIGKLLYDFLSGHIRFV